MTGAEMIVQVLADEGVTTIFGYSGGAILPTYDAVFCFNEDRAKNEPQMRSSFPRTNRARAVAAGYARRWPRGRRHHRRAGPRTQ
jgi:acetolactate synthase-1/2/3 large subunit